MPESIPKVYSYAERGGRLYAFLPDQTLPRGYRTLDLPAALERYGRAEVVYARRRALRKQQNG